MAREGAAGDVPLACVLRSVTAAESSLPPPQPQHRAAPGILDAQLNSLRSLPPNVAPPARAMSLPRNHGSRNQDAAPPPPMLRRQKGVERSAEDLAASITAAHAILGLNPEPALAQLGISPMALEAIMKQRSLGRAGGALPPPPVEPHQPPLPRRVASFKPRARSTHRAAPPELPPPRLRLAFSAAPLAPLPVPAPCRSFSRAQAPPRAACAKRTGTAQTPRAPRAILGRARRRQLARRPWPYRWLPRPRCPFRRGLTTRRRTRPRIRRRPTSRRAPWRARPRTHLCPPPPPPPSPAWFRHPSPTHPRPAS